MLYLYIYNSKSGTNEILINSLRSGAASFIIAMYCLCNVLQYGGELVTVTGPTVDFFKISRCSTVYLEVDSKAPRIFKKVYGRTSYCD